MASTRSTKDPPVGSGKKGVLKSTARKCLYAARNDSLIGDDWCGELYSELKDLRRSALRALQA